MSVFPVTSVTLLQKMAAEVTGERESAWARFFALYQPAMRKFVEWHGGVEDPDDVVQMVLEKLVNVLKNRQYDHQKANFRSYLSTMIRNAMFSLYRKSAARGGGLNVSLDEILDAQLDPDAHGGFHKLDASLICSANQLDQIDLHWARACHDTAVEHVLTKTAMSARNREIYREYVIKARPAAEVAREFGVTKNLVGQIKFRVDRAIEGIELEFACA